MRSSRLFIERRSFTANATAAHTARRETFLSKNQIIWRTTLILFGIGCALAPVSFARARVQHAPSPYSVDASRNAGPVFHLLAARSDVGSSRFRQSLDHLGLAETRLLNDQAATPSQPIASLQRALSDVSSARSYAARGLRSATIGAIDDALRSLQAGDAVVAAAGVEPLRVPQPPPFPMQAPIPAATQPSILYRLDPGHWQLRGSDSVWVEPQSIPQPVSTEGIIPAREVWNGERWIFVPEHFTGGVPVR